MPFNSEQLAYAGKHAIDFFLKNDPVDNINTERPLLNALVKGKKNYAGGLQYVVEQLRKSNDSNFQSYFGDQQVTYNRKRTLEQAKFEWGSFHDGFGLNEDELAQNSITLTDDRGASPSPDERARLTNLLNENMATLKEGYQEGMDLMLHRDGSSSATDIVGLDGLVSIDPTNTVGGLSGAANTWWQNQAPTAVAASALIQRLEETWRECIRRCKTSPNFILVGSDFLDVYRAQASETVNRQVTLGGPQGNMQSANLDAGVGMGHRTGLYFKGVELIWDPVFDELDALDAPASTWAKRCYMLNLRHLCLRPITGHWMVSRNPPRVYDRYVHYWALTSKASLTTNQRNAHAVVRIT
jgi:hypothetical protein